MIEEASYQVIWSREDLRWFPVRRRLDVAENWHYQDEKLPRVVFRPACKEDLEQISREGRGYLNCTKGLTIGAFRHKKLLGFKVIKPLVDEDYVGSEFTFVEERWRGKGVGVSLCRAALDLVGKLGYRGIQGEVVEALAKDKEGRLRFLTQVGDYGWGGTGGLPSLKAVLKTTGEIWVPDQGIARANGERFDVHYIQCCKAGEKIAGAVRCRDIEDVRQAAEKILEKEKGVVS